MLLRIMRHGLNVAVILLIAGCAGPQWTPKGHESVAVISAIVPTGSRVHHGLNFIADRRDPSNIPFDVNAEIKSAVETSLDKSSRYSLVQVAFDPKEIGADIDMWDWHTRFDTLPMPIAGKFVQAARSSGADYLIVIMDFRDAHTPMRGGWGFYQSQLGCYDVYIDFYVFILDAHTGVTADSLGRVGYRRIQDINWDALWPDLPAPKQAEILADLKDMAGEDVPRVLMNMGVIADDGKSDYLAPSFNPIPATCALPWR